MVYWWRIEFTTPEGERIAIAMYKDIVDAFRANLAAKGCTDLRFRAWDGDKSHLGVQ